jgi:hypothetical protein
VGQPSPAQIEQYDIGDFVHTVASFVGTDGVTPATPSTVMFLLMNPSGIVATYQFGVAGASILQVGSAAYARDFTLTQAGSWFYRWEGTGMVQAADEWSVIAARSRFYT